MHRRARGRHVAYVAGSAALVGSLLLYFYHQVSRDSASGRTGSPETILEQAAFRRFTTTTPSVTGPDGKLRLVTDPGRAKALKVLHFKQMLVNEELAHNPGLTGQADENLRESRPALVRVTWDSPAGEESVEKIIADTVSCGLAELGTPARLSFQQLKELSCLYDDDPAYWDTVETSVTVSRTSIGEDEVEWEKLREKEMRDIVAWKFVQATLQAQQQE
jgi:hypothetical protein